MFFCHYSLCLPVEEIGWTVVTDCCNHVSILLLLQALQLQSLNVLALSTYNFHLLRSWMQLIQFFIFIFFMSFLMSSSLLFFGLPCGRIDIGFHLYTYFLPFSLSAIQCKWPNQLNRCAFMWFTVFLCLINSSNSSFVLILHVPSLPYVGPNIWTLSFQTPLTCFLWFLSRPTIHSHLLLLVL